MYLRFFKLTILILSNIGFCFGQQFTQSVSGVVLDRISRQPISGANVSILNTEPLLGTITDNNGKFTIENVPIGRQDIQVSFLGYEIVILQGNLISSSKSFVVTIELQELPQSLGEVVLSPVSNQKPLNKMAKVSARSFSIEEASRFAGGLSDPARVAYNFPGATFGAPQDNGVVIRGNSPTNVLWRINGLEVSGASHFGGGNLAGAGLITIFSSNVLGTSDFLTGAFPAEYGNVTSGVFDINFKKGTTDKNKWTTQLGILGIDIATEGRFKKKSEASYLINYRHGFIGYYGRLAGGVAPDYQDISFNLSLPTAKGGNFNIWGIGGLSAIFTPYGEYEMKEDEIKQRETENDFQQDDIDFDMAAVGINHKIKLGNRSLLNSTLGFTSTGYESSSEWFTPDADTLNTGSLTPYSYLQNRESKITLTSNLTHKFSENIYITSGIIADYINFNAIARQADKPQEPLMEFLNAKDNTYYLQTYGQTNVRLTPKINIQAGINISHFGLSGETTFEPRVGLRWKPLRDLSIGLGYGRHSRREELKVYFFDYIDDTNQKQNNTNLDRTKANHYIASIDWNITKNLKLSIEGYYQELSKVPVAVDSSYSVANYTQLWELDKRLINQGMSTNKGIDIALEQVFHKDYYYLISASFFDSKYIGGDGVERNTLFNREYFITLTAGKEFKISRKKKNKVNLLGINMNAAYLGGQRETPFIEAESILEQEVILDYDSLYSLQNDPELWINFGVTYKSNKAKSTTTWGLDFQNVTLKEQQQGYEYNFVTNQIQEAKVLFLLPNFYYKIEF